MGEIGELQKPNYEHYSLSKSEAREYYIKSVLSILIVGLIFYGNFAVPMVLSLLTVPCRRFFEEYKLKQMKENLRYSFRDLLYALDASISSGRQMAEALVEAEGTLSVIYSEKEPIMKELAIMTKAIKQSNANEEKLLKDFAYRSKVEEIMSFAETYSICRSTGANVKNVIAQTTKILVDKLTIAREIKTLTAQKQVEGRIISIMPLVIIVFLNLMSPGYLDKLYHTGIGMLIMTLALGIIVLAYVLMGRILDIKL